jgi:hypothetical protein
MAVVVTTCFLVLRLKQWSVRITFVQVVPSHFHHAALAW